MKEKINIFKNGILIISLLIYSYLIFIGRNQYIFNMSYMKCIIFILFLFLFIYLYGIVKNNKKTYKTNVNIYILLYFILMISITFFIGRTNIRIYDWWYAGQYQPFHTILSQLSYDSIASILKNVVGNSIMLIPLSFLLMIKNPKYNNILRQLVIILPTIIGIEILQSSTHVGIFDIDDILLNYLGTLIFTFIITRFSIINKIRKIFYTDFKIKKRNKYILFYLGSILLMIYIILILILK